MTHEFPHYNREASLAAIDKHCAELRQMVERGRCVAFTIVVSKDEPHRILFHGKGHEIGAAVLCASILLETLERDSSCSCPQCELAALAAKRMLTTADQLLEAAHAPRLQGPPS